MDAISAAALIETKIAEYGDINTSVWSKKGVRVYLSSEKRKSVVEHGYIDIVGGEGLAALNLKTLTKYEAAMWGLLKPAFEGVTVEAPTSTGTGTVYAKVCVECGSKIWGAHCTNCAGC